MNSINHIEIIINEINHTKLFNIDVRKKIISSKNNSYIMTKEKIEELLRIIRLWKKNYDNKKIIDSEEFYLKIYTDNSTDVYHGKGNYPSNYDEFKEWLGNYDD